MTEYTQHQRDQLVAAFLDITLGQFIEGIQKDEVFNEVKGSDFESYLTVAIDSLKRQSDLDAAQPDSNFVQPDTSAASERYAHLYVQQVAMLSDASLHRVVQLFGTDPLS